LEENLNFFSKLVVDAITSVKDTKEGIDSYSVNSVTILKKQGKSARDSELISGFALNCKRASQGMPSIVKNAKIALLDIDLHRQKLQLGVQVIINDPDKLEEIQQKEILLIKNKLKLMFDCGANVILTSKGIDDICLKYICDAKAIGVRRCEVKDLKKLQN